MSPQEIRLKNLVTDEFYDSFKTVIVVESINDKGINLEIANSDDFPEMQTHWIEPYYEFDKLRGIPLTEEWLLKFGFWKREGSNVWNNGIGNYRYCIHQTGMVFPFDIRSSDSTYFIDTPKYVHQLQNLYFALTGEELTIKE